MRQIDVLIFVEHVARELDIVCAMRHRLQTEHKLQVEVASYCKGVTETLRRVSPRVIAVPYCYSREDMGMKDVWLRSRGFTVVNLAFEQLFSLGNKQFKRPRDAMARSEVLHLAAGSFFGEFLESHQVPRANIHLAGSLSCAAYRAPYRRYFEVDRSAFASKHGLDVGRPWIFFPENFGAAFFSDREILRRIRGGADETVVREYCDLSRRALSQLASWCQQAAKRTEAEIVLRPRPSTPLQTLLEAVKSSLDEPLAPRFRVIKAESVREWVLTSDHTVSNFSTSLVEAAVAGKPASLLVPCPLPSSMHSDWHDHTATVTSCDEFVELATNHSSSGSCSLKTWADEHLMGQGDPISNAAEIIADVTQGRRSMARVLPPSTGRRLKEASRQWWRQRKHRWRSRPKASPRRSIDFFEDDQFDRAEVEKRTIAWEEILREDQQQPSATLPHIHPARA